MYSSRETKMYIDNTVVHRPSPLLPLTACACFSFYFLDGPTLLIFLLPAAISCQWYWKAVSGYVGLPRGEEKKSLLSVEGQVRRISWNQWKAWIPPRQDSWPEPWICVSTPGIFYFYVLMLVHRHYYGQYMKKFNAANSIVVQPYEVNLNLNQTGASLYQTHQRSRQNHSIKK